MFYFSKGRCTRENCKYLHPPPHLKTQLEINGRNNLIQQKTAAAMLAQQMQFMLPGAQLQPIVSVDAHQPDAHAHTCTPFKCICCVVIYSRCLYPKPIPS